MVYLIIPSDNSNLEIDPKYLSLKLRERWPMIDIKYEKSYPMMLLEWQIIDDSINHVGTLHSDKRTIAIDDYPQGIAEFTIWYKKIIAYDHEIFIYHDGNAEMAVKVTNETSLDRIKNQLDSET